MKSLKVFFLVLPFLFFSCKTEGQMITAIQQKITPQPSAGWTMSGLKITKTEPLYGAGYKGKTIAFTAKAMVHPELPKGSGRFYFHSGGYVTETGKEFMEGNFESSAVVCAAGSTFTVTGGGRVSDDLTLIDVKKWEYAPLNVLTPEGEDIRTQFLGKWFGNLNSGFVVTESYAYTEGADRRAITFFSWTMTRDTARFVYEKDHRFNLVGTLNPDASMLTLARDGSRYDYSRNEADHYDTTNMVVRKKICEHAWFAADSTTATDKGYMFQFALDGTMFWNQRSFSGEFLWTFSSNKIRILEKANLKEWWSCDYLPESNTMGSGKTMLSQVSPLYAQKITERIQSGSGLFQNENGVTIRLNKDNTCESSNGLFPAGSKWVIYDGLYDYRTGRFLPKKDFHLKIVTNPNEKGERNYRAAIGLSGPIVLEGESSPYYEKN